MSMVGTFDGFTAARLGLYAAQHGLRVTGNNVANINTVGYTRQRTDQISFKVGNNDMYRSFYDNHVGSGSLVTGINQIRDPYLDIRYRNASTDTYHYDTWLSGLQNIASILDEVGKGDNKDGLIYKAIQDLAEKLRSYSASPTSLNDRLVRNSAASLTLLFHNAATRLENLYKETVSEFNENVSAVNEILTNIRDLNKSIREAEIHGDTALEMRDERNRQIDALSQYLDINVQYSFEDVGAGVQVEKLTIKLNDANPDNSVHTDESILVDGLYATQLSIPEEKPVLNTYGDEYAYLKGYKYLKKVTEDELEDYGLIPDDFTSMSPPPPTVTEKSPGGWVTKYYLIGTNNPDEEGIYTEPNDNFTIQLGKLLNAKGAEWKSNTTTWVEISSSQAPSKAVYTYHINIDESAITDGIIQDGLTFKIAKNSNPQGDDDYYVYTVGQGGVPSDKAGLLKFIADELNQTKRYPGYTISSDGENLIFTADNPGEVGKKEDVEAGAPAAAPDLTVTTDTGIPGWLSLDGMTEKPGHIPGDTDSVEYDDHGNIIKTVNYVEAEGKWYRLTVSTQHTYDVILDDNDLHGILQAERELLTEEGEFASAKDVFIDESALSKRGIPYYMKSLDLLAQKFAEAYNQLNVGYAYNQDGNYIDEDGYPLMLEDASVTPPERRPVSSDGLTAGQQQYLIDTGYFLQDENGNAIDKDGNIITDANGDPITADMVDSLSPSYHSKLVVDFDKWMADNHAIPMGGCLFTGLDGETTTGITAKTISISNGWSNGLWNLVPTFKMLFSDDGNGGLTNSTENDNADHMVAMIDNALTYDPRDLYGSDAIGPELFSGSFNDMLSNMMSVEGEDASITNVRLTTYATALNELDFSREGVSGVDLNDEAMNMITYSKAMSAAMRVMTVIDEMLDRLINNTAI